MCANGGSIIIMSHCGCKISTPALSAAFGCAQGKLTEMLLEWAFSRHSIMMSFAGLYAIKHVYVTFVSLANRPTITLSCCISVSTNAMLMVDYKSEL